MNAQTFAETLAKAKADKAAFSDMRKAVEAAPDSSNGTAWRDELLAAPETLSPRLKWMQEHGITVKKTDNPDSPEDQSYCAFGPCTMAAARTEDGAIVRLAQKLNLRLWNQL